ARRDTFLQACTAHRAHQYPGRGIGSKPDRHPQRAVCRGKKVTMRPKQHQICKELAERSSRSPKHLGALQRSATAEFLGVRQLRRMTNWYSRWNNREMLR